jgi:hypothetical protein
MREAYDKIVLGRAVDVGVLYDSVEAHPRVPLTPEALRFVLPKVRGDAVWLRHDDPVRPGHHDLAVTQPADVAEPDRRR